MALQEYQHTLTDMVETKPSYDTAQLTAKDQTNYNKIIKYSRLHKICEQKEILELQEQNLKKQIYISIKVNQLIDSTNSIEVSYDIHITIYTLLTYAYTVSVSIQIQNRLRELHFNKYFKCEEYIDHELYLKHESKHISDILYQLRLLEQNILDTQDDVLTQIINKKMVYYSKVSQNNQSKLQKYFISIILESNRNQKQKNSLILFGSPYLLDLLVSYIALINKSMFAN